VAAAAAKQGGVNFAFDSEDYHYGCRRQQVHAAVTVLPGTKVLTRVTVPSQPIRSTGQHYGIPRPTTIHNVFHWSDQAHWTDG
jgi:hypothetical protein